MSVVPFKVDVYNTNLVMKIKPEIKEYIKSLPEEHGQVCWDFYSFLGNKYPDVAHRLSGVVEVLKSNNPQIEKMIELGFLEKAKEE